ncbi:hypothetical protein BZA77DRAFT_358236 [Pyronema omphalodes]|nr:hypothetical protein BZA77DRAFT_358236 [Pyronema omphalodes]
MVRNVGVNQVVRIHGLYQATTPSEDPYKLQFPLYVDMLLDDNGCAPLIFAEQQSHRATALQR